VGWARVAWHKRSRSRPGALYTVAANGIIAGGERFTAMRDQAWDKRVVGTGLDALVAWFERR
jgi:hypothetical protein